MTHPARDIPAHRLRAAAAAAAVKPPRKPRAPKVPKPAAKPKARR